MKTIIAIPSYGRANNRGRIKFCTANWICQGTGFKIVYYVEPEEMGDYQRMLKDTRITLRTADRAEVPKKWGSIMDLIVDECCEQCDHLVIMDDDLKLNVRPNLPDEPTRFEVMIPERFRQMIADLRKITTSVAPLTSTQYRQFCNGKTSEYQVNQRISMIWSLRSRFFKYHPEFRFYRQSKLDFMTDYYFFLNLLVHGYPNLCINKYTKDDKPNAPGGEKEKRILEVFNRAVRRFAEMFPKYVTLREKRGKGNWRDGMLGVTIQSSKAYRENKKATSSTGG